MRGGAVATPGSWQTRVITTGVRMTPHREQGTHRARVVSHPAVRGPPSCSACAGDNEKEALLQAHHPVAHVRSDGDHNSLTPSMRFGPRARPHSQAAPGHPRGR